MKFELKNISRLLLVLATLITACVEPYDAPNQKSGTDFLVVDGFLNVTDSTARVVVRHSVPLASNEQPVSETDAIVTIVDDLNNSVALQSLGNGVYTGNKIVYDFNRTYMVNIRTSDSGEYGTDPITLKRTPPIDSVNWDVENDVLNINVYTHDPTGNSKFYKWDFVETYQYTAPNNSQFILKPKGEYVLRPDSLSLYNCWRTNGSTTINVASSTRLTADIISHKTIRSIHGGTILLSKTYSILVQQQSLTEEAYNYWLNLQKTTESLGGLFDPLPSEVIGNLHAITGQQQVAGYVSGGEVSELRVFIEPKDRRGLSHYSPIVCVPDTVLLKDLHLLSYQDGLVAPVYSSGGPPVVTGFLYTGSSACNDCRVAGGTTQKPSFWNH